MKRAHPGNCKSLAWIPMAGVVLVAVFLGSGCATPQQTGALAIGSAIVAAASMPSHDMEQTYYLGAFDPEEQLPPAMYRITVRGQSSALNNTRFASGWVPAYVIDSLRGQVGIDPNSEEPVKIQEPGKSLGSEREAQAGASQLGSVTSLGIKDNQAILSQTFTSTSSDGTQLTNSVSLTVTNTTQIFTNVVSTKASKGVAAGAGDANFKIGRRLVMFGPEGFREAPRGHRLVIVMGSSPDNFFKGIDTALGDMSGMSIERANSSTQAEIFKEYSRIQALRIGLGQVKADIESDLKR